MKRKGEREERMREKTKNAKVRGRGRKRRRRRRREHGAKEKGGEKKILAYVRVSAGADVLMSKNLMQRERF